MKKIFFIRHAKSSWGDIMLRDFDRPLNTRGLNDAPFMAEYLKNKISNIDMIVSSPANRAWSTATYFAESFDIKTENVLKWKSLYEGIPEDYYELLTGISEEANKIIILGHNPAISYIAATPGSRYFNVSTCGIVEMSFQGDWSEFDANRLKLVSYINPKMARGSYE